MKDGKMGHLMAAATRRGVPGGLHNNSFSGKTQTNEYEPRAPNNTTHGKVVMPVD